MENPSSTTESGNIVIIKHPQFGRRRLHNEDDVFTHNAWDNVEWNSEQEEEALQMVAKNSSLKMTTEQSKVYRLAADKFWNSFYSVHENRFFKDRHWLFTEFPELCNESNKHIFELGCGVGNTLLPILKASRNAQMYGCDFSTKAIEIFKMHADFDDKRCQVFIMDVANLNWQVPFEEASLDIVILIFVLSAIEYNKLSAIVENCYRYLKPSGLVLLRDYGRFDMAQLRFKTGKCIADNFYVRGDGTMVYFFTNEEIHDLFTKAGFIEEQSKVDKRLQVNRGRMLKMYRVWLQAKYRKP